MTEPRAVPAAVLARQVKQLSAQIERLRLENLALYADQRNTDERLSALLRCLDTEQAYVKRYRDERNTAVREIRALREELTQRQSYETTS